MLKYVKIVLSMLTEAFVASAVSLALLADANRA